MGVSAVGKVRSGKTLEIRVRRAKIWAIAWEQRANTTFAAVDAAIRYGHIERALQQVHYLHQDIYKGLSAVDSISTAITGQPLPAVHRLVNGWTGTLNKTSAKLEMDIQEGDFPQTRDVLRGFLEFCQSRFAELQTVFDTLV